MSKHTPGPWIADIRSNWTSHWIKAGDHDERGICRIANRTSLFPPIDDEGIANARLIAAAPDLLAALLAIAEGCSFPADDVQRAVRDRARAAISIATGGEQQDATSRRARNDDAPRQPPLGKRRDC